MNVNEKTCLRVSPLDRPAIAAAFRLARKDLGFTQSALAQALGSSQGAITRWERGKDSPPISALLFLARCVPEEKRDFWIEAAGFDPSKTSLTEIRNMDLPTAPPSKLGIRNGSEEVAVSNLNESPIDRELLTFAIDAVNAELKKTGREPQNPQYAELIALIYDLSHKTGNRNLDMVEAIFKTARSAVHLLEPGARSDGTGVAAHSQEDRNYHGQSGTRKERGA